MPNLDYYQILGVPPDADIKQIKEAYREQALAYHPDRNQNDAAATEKMKLVNEAYAVLADTDKRREYDALRHQFGSNAHQHFRQQYTYQDIFKDSDIHHIFDEISRAFGLRGVDEIFKEFYGSGYRQFEFRRPGFSAKGFFFGGAFQFRPSGQHGRPPFKLPFGRLTQFLLEKVGGIAIPEDGKDIQDSIRISPGQADQGGPFAYRHRQTSKKLIVKIPSGIRSGQRIRLTGLGAAGKAGGNPGDLYLKVRIHRPLIQKLTKTIKGRKR